MVDTYFFLVYTKNPWTVHIPRPNQTALMRQILTVQHSKGTTNCFTTLLFILLVECASPHPPSLLKGYCHGKSKRIS
ncbi:hypothetical protein XELAEV_18006982mg [Xenopus laevis]|uniref:Uncharacterized protein n=1 Tax=Xenopus laevis TaxID=8355 RepID=A0A974I4Q4_XENLA|nr:hypothetical protein XELAEV_18006982mg [Xenopus laevis]